MKSKWHATHHCKIDGRLSVEYEPHPRMKSIIKIESTLHAVRIQPEQLDALIDALTHIRDIEPYKRDIAEEDNVDLEGDKP